MSNACEKLGLPLYLSQPGRIEDIARNLESFGTLGGNEAAVARGGGAGLRARHADLQKRFAGAAAGQCLLPGLEAAA
jgi:iron complex transport system substrate-binding protein